jgi:hypothetical protein
MTKKIPKIAILFSGQARFFDSEPYDSIKKHLLDKYDCDVFCHFWWDNGIGLKYECSPWNGWEEIPIRSDTFQKLYDLYKPKSIKWNFPLAREDCDFGYKTIHINTPYNIRSMYTSLQRVYNHFEEFQNSKNGCKTKYDFIIRIRYDTIITAFPDLTKLNNEYLYVYDKYEDRIMYPEDKYPGISNIAINECWITNEENAKKLFQIKNHIENLYSKTDVISDEQLFTEYVKQLNIKVVKLNEKEFCTIVPYKSTHNHLK